MRKLLFLMLVLCFSSLSFAQIEGKWKTIDDNIGKAKSIVEIYKKSDGRYYGKVVKLLITPADPKCSKCTDDRKNTPILGMEVIRGIEKDGSDFDGGTITDPKTGKVYKCTISRDGNKLNVRGYIGFSLLGRTQTWLKVD
ncbi:DUF2147 domain-containing protein [Riemerella columbipharyngis]|uniref:Uncharacterized conserved protein, DUF2147 family n=1 Tax=Riemerella columbipharyngis TaxID=1071918 RepID=A0A1G7DXM6_9FLAO|nr:DUF2147 domain-containing protein [Riemerella columbipharyngis]SDE55896.1 Uncharacterized conserved protein, DUF2147 family [Riemerella columbipharyngis]